MAYKNKTPFHIWLVCFTLSASILSCNTQRVLNPSLPTSTPRPSNTAIIPTLDQPTDQPTPTISSPPLPTYETGLTIESAEQAFFNQDWDTALKEYQLIFDTISDPEYFTAALLGLGKTNYMMDEYSTALSHLRALVDQYPDSEQAPFAYYYLARIYSDLGRFSEAITAYQNYLTLHPGILEDYVYEWIGDSFVSLLDYPNALSSYESALEYASLEEQMDIYVKMGDASIQIGQLNNALDYYNLVYESTGNDYVKAQMNYLRGKVYLDADAAETAYGLYLSSITNYPYSYYSYLSLVDLVEANITVSELDRGLVDYYAGQYSVAVAAFDRYMQYYPNTEDDTAMHFKALSQVALGESQAAVDTWEAMLEKFPNGAHRAEAVDEIAYLRWAVLNNYKSSIQSYLDFVASEPGNPSAPEFLYQAARIAEIHNDLTTASLIWSRIAPEYPESTWVYESLFQAGLANYRLSDNAMAASQFLSSINFTTNSEEKSRAYFWAGKAYQAVGEATSSVESFQNAISIDPTGYYCIRANELLTGIYPFHSSQDPLYTYDINAEKAEAEDWMRTTFNLPAETDFSDYSFLRQDIRMVRGTEFWNLGEYALAKFEFESLRMSLTSDALNTYKLANFLIHDLGLYRSGITAARQVLTLGGLGSDADTLKAPVYFNHLRFGTYYWNLVTEQAYEYDLDPLLIFSVIRQESLFEGFVASSAGARGLMQIMPATGENQAVKLSWPVNYNSDDLYRPAINIPFGVNYLATQYHYFDENYFAMLAGYNAGPGNTNAWITLAQNDNDLLVEIIRFSETRDYIRSVYEIYDIYRNLY